MRFEVKNVPDIKTFSRENQSRFDMIIMSHVLEHIQKQDIVPALKSVKSMLSENGRLCVISPNAQSNRVLIPYCVIL